jgi:ligand-binding sensor protein
LVGASFDLVFVDTHGEPLRKLIDWMPTCDESHTPAD